VRQPGRADEGRSQWRRRDRRSVTGATVTAEDCPVGRSGRSGVRRRQKTGDGRTRWDSEEFAYARRKVTADDPLDRFNDDVGEVWLAATFAIEVRLAGVWFVDVSRTEQT
jgi:hypothetical protein